MRVCFGVGLFGCVCVGAFKIFVQGSLSRETYEKDTACQSAMVSFYGLSAVGLLALFMCAGLCAKRVTENIRPVALEVIASSSLIVFMVLAVLMQPAHVAQLMGHSVSDTFAGQYFSDSFTLLFIDATLTAVHIGCPMRWCAMLPLEVAGVLLYTLIIFVIGSFEPMVENAYNILLLTSVVVLAALGKRATETCEREAFLEIIKEKKLRCKAEHQLAQVAQVHSPNKEEDALSGSKRGSTYTDNASHKVFDAFDDADSNMTGQLDGVGRLGIAEHWRITETDVKILRKNVLGTGGYGQVCKAVFCGMVVAVKIPHDKLKASHMQKLPALCNELRILRRVRHMNIVTFHGCLINPAQRKIAVVMELVRGAVLTEVVKGGSGKEIGTIARYQLMLGICNALFYLHTRQPGIVHGDLKARNVLVESVNDVLVPKLLDFGLSRTLSRHPRRLGGTLAWMAPEVLRSESPVKCSADVYSFGRMLPFIATSIDPMQGLSARRIRKALTQGRPPLPTWPNGCVFEPSCNGIVQACLRVEESERPAISEVHAKLVFLPQELNLLEIHGHVLEDVQLVAEHCDRGAAHWDFEQQVSEMSSLADHDESGSLQQLPPLAEDDVPMPPEAPPGAAQPRRKRLTRLHPFPNRMETCKEGMLATLDKALWRWNFKLPQAACCEVHERLNILLQLCHLELGKPCRQDRSQQNATQCGSCGVLGVAGPRCDSCGSDEDVSAWTSL